MRIALINSHLNPGGADGGALALAGGLTRRGHDVTLYVPGYDRAAWDEFPAGRARIGEIPVLRRSSLRNWLAGARLLAGELSRYDLINVHLEPSPIWAMLARWWSRKPLPPVVWYVHSLPHFNCDYYHYYQHVSSPHYLRAEHGNPHPINLLGQMAVSSFRRQSTEFPGRINLVSTRQWLITPFDWLAARSVDGILANSDFTARQVAAVYGRPATGCLLGNFNVPPAGEEECQWEDNYALVVTRLIRRKNVAAILRALALAAGETDLRLKIAGEGPEGPALQRLADSLGIGDRVDFVGFVSGRKLADCYRRCRLVVHVPFDEPFGLIFVEAGASRKPIIGPNQGGPAEVVVDGETGYLVDPCDVEAIARRMVELAGDVERCREMGEAAYRRMEEHFTLEHWLDRLEAGFGTVLGATTGEAWAPVAQSSTAAPVTAPPAIRATTRLSKLRMAVLNPHMKLGGADSSVMALVRGLAERGHRVTLYTAAYDNAVWGDPRDHGLTVREMPQMAANTVQNWISVVRQLARELPEFDLVDAHLEPAYIWVYLARCLARHFPATTWYVHSLPYFDCEYYHPYQHTSSPNYLKSKVGRTNPALLFGWMITNTFRGQDERYPGRLDRRCFRQWAITPLDWMAARGVDQIFANSQFVADQIKRVYGREAVACHPGRTEPIFQRAAPTPLADPGYLLAVTRLLHRKNVGNIIRAFALLERQDGLRLKVAGDGPEDEVLRELAEELGVAGSVDFLGFVSGEALVSLYTACKIVVHMPYDEPFGLTFVEAGAAHKPVIASNHGGPAESVLDGVTGLLVDPAQPAAIADAMRALLEDEGRCVQMGEAAYTHILQEYGADRWVERMEAHLLELVSSAGKTPSLASVAKDAHSKHRIG